MAERARNVVGRMTALCAVAVLAAACGRVEEVELALEPYEDRGSFGALELTLAPDREHRVVVCGRARGAGARRRVAGPAGDGADAAGQGPRPEDDAEGREEGAAGGGPQGPADLAGDGKGDGDGVVEPMEGRRR